MTFIHKKTRLFMDRGDVGRRRSEGRLKTYGSAIDARAWCDIVEDRRQHIIELINKGAGKCSGLIPIEAILEVLLSSKNADITNLKCCLLQLWKFIEGLNLSGEEKGRLASLKQKMDKTCTDAIEEKSKCVAKKRHDKARAEIETLTDDSPGTYKVVLEEPGKVTTRIKGIKLGYEIAPGKTTGNVTTRAQGSSKVKATVTNVCPNRESENKEANAAVLKPMRKGTDANKDPDINYDDPVGQINKMRDQLVAREALCNEQQMIMENLKTERDELKNKLDNCLQEMDNIKKMKGLGDGGAMPLSCEEEISALELEIEVMRSGNLSPEQEAEIIKKEVEMLRKYCLKLKSIEDENERLKGQEGITVCKCKDAIEDENQKLKMYGSKEKFSHLEELNGKLQNLEEIIKERDALANKVEKLEKELLQYRHLPDDIDVYRERSKMLDSALEERDKMNMKVEQMKDLENELNYLRKKAARVDELEQELKFYNTTDTNATFELKKTKSRCCCLERELQNVKMEKDSMGKRIDHMKREMDILKGKSKEAEMLKLERDKLQIKLNELSHVQVQHENLMMKCKCLENVARERDSYKQKYDDILSMECQCEMLRSQVEEARDLARERDGLVKQVRDLESCICDQENEIKKLALQIDDINRNKDESQIRMKDALANMRAEVEKKDYLIAASEEKLASVQSQLKSSIQGVSCETICYKTRIEDLERELNKSHSQIKTLQKQLRASHTSLKTTKQLTRSECDSVAVMKLELEAAKAENKKLQEIANKMAALTGDEHVQKMLRQSECAVKRVVEELSKQYKEWDQFKSAQKKRKTCSAMCNQVSDVSESEGSDRFKEELEDIQREKEKLEKLVKEIQNDKSAEGPQKELISLRIENSNLQAQLQSERKQRRDLEKMLNK